MTISSLRPFLIVTFGLTWGIAALLMWLVVWGLTAAPLGLF